MDIKTVGIVGAGQMGNGIAQDALNDALAKIDGNLTRQVSRDKITEDDKQATLARISTTLALPEIGPSDLIIEAATEHDPDLEHLLHLDHPAGLAHRQAREIHGLPLHEPTSATAEDFPAFIVNRILMPMINEAVYTLYEGVGSVSSIDSAMKLGTNHPMGPLELADFIGLDTCLAIMNVLHDGLADTKYRPCPLLTKYVEAGWLGRKSQRGFYDYRVDPPKPTR